MPAESAPPGSTRRWGTVRFRVTALATAVVLGVLVVAGLAVVRVQERTLVDNLEETLDQASALLAGALRDGEAPSGVAAFGDDDAVYQVVNADSTVRDASANVEGAPPLTTLPPGDDIEVAVVDDLLHDGARFLVRSERVVLADGPVTVHLAATLDDIDESVAALTATLVTSVPLITVILALVLWFVVGRALRPVEAMRAEVATISGSDLHRRVPSPPGDDEIARLARTMNGMLDRIEDSAERQQRFVSDASHELRSPLTRMRAELEVDLRHPGGADPYATHRSVLEEALGLQQLVEDLLHLARSDAGGAVTATTTSPVDLDEVVRRVADALHGRPGVTVDVAAVAPVRVEGHPERLRRLVANLLDNAVRHAAAVVAVELRTDAGLAVLTVTDDGPGIPVADAERVFERFTRLDDARAAASGGTGLGLAIALDIASAHGGHIDVDTAHEGGARLVVRLPLSPRP